MHKTSVLLAVFLMCALLGTSCSNSSAPDKDDPPDDQIALVAPGSAVVVPENSALSLEWSALPEAVGYQVWYGENDDTDTAVQSAANISGSSYRITGLENGTPYYIWLKAEYSGGVSAFGESSTATPIGIPIVETALMPGTTEYWSNVYGTSFYASWKLINAGDSALTARGFCWSSTNPNPTKLDSFNTGTAGITPYQVLLTDLTINTRYYFRAYATNSLGTAYGEVHSIKSGFTRGTEMEGGSVFYNDGYGNGTVQSTSYVPATVPWISGGSTQTTANSNTRSDIGYGIVNSYSIVAQEGHVSSAAQVCLDFSAGGYDDWYLPSYNEGFTKLLNASGTWSSTELSANIASTFSGMSFAKSATSYSSLPVRDFYSDSIARPYYVQVTTPAILAVNSLGLKGAVVRAYTGETIQLQAPQGYHFSTGSIPDGWQLTDNPTVCRRTMGSDNLVVTGVTVVQN